MTKITAAQQDFSSMALNMKRAKSTSQLNMANNTNYNLGPNQGCTVSFTVAEACNAFVIVTVGTHSTTDYESKPLIYLDGNVQTVSEMSASVNGTTSNRAIQRTVMNIVPLTVGAHTLSAGITVSSSTSGYVSAGEAEIMVLVLGRVTA